MHTIDTPGGPDRRPRRRVFLIITFIYGQLLSLNLYVIIVFISYIISILLNLLLLLLLFIYG